MQILSPLPVQSKESPPAPIETDRKIIEAAKQFEAVFIGEMTKLMMETVPEDKRFGGGNAESIYKGLLAEQMGSAIVQKGGIGIAPNVMKEIIAMQGGR